MIPVTCPCCEVPHRPHNAGCTYAADCPSGEADWAEVASLRREVMLLNRKVEALKERDDLSVRVNNEHVKTQASLRADIARLQADVRRHKMTEEERVAMGRARDFLHLSTIDLARHTAGALSNYLKRTAPPAAS